MKVIKFDDELEKWQQEVERQIASGELVEDTYTPESELSVTVVDDDLPGEWSSTDCSDDTYTDPTLLPDTDTGDDHTLISDDDDIGLYTDDADDLDIGF